MIFSSKEILAIRILAEKKLREVNDTSAVEGLKAIIDKCNEGSNEYSLRLHKDKKAYIDDVVNIADSMIGSYHGMMGDMSNIEGYDSIKKQCVAVMSSLGDIVSEMSAMVDLYDDKLRQYRDEIACGLVASGEKVGMADKIARSDPKYKRAVIDFAEYSVMRNKVQNKLKAVDALHKSVVQSLSAARVTMIKESYNE